MTEERCTILRRVDVGLEDLAVVQAELGCGCVRLYHVDFGEHGPSCFDFTLGSFHSCCADLEDEVFGQVVAFGVQELCKAPALR